MPDEKRSVELVDFKTWLLTEYVNTEPPQGNDYFAEFVLKVRLDYNWPTGQVTLSQLLAYIDAQEADDLTKVQLIVAWTRYLDDNANFVSAREMHDLKQVERLSFRNIISGADRVLLNNTLERIKMIERACCRAGSFESGIAWQTSL